MNISGIKQAAFNKISEDIWYVYDVVVLWREGARCR